jgi:uncharacterized protein
LFRILSIDGGGIRGILAAEILAKLEALLIERSGDKNTRLADHFDLIAGTSTGGILSAIYLFPSDDLSGRPKYNAIEASELYLENAKKIFKRKMDPGSQDKYSSEELKSVLCEYFSDRQLSQLLKPSIITSYNIQKSSTHFFTSHDAKVKPGYNYYLWQVAMATCAAPGFFSPALARSFAGKEYILVDGGVFANNPSLCAFAEARNYRLTQGVKLLTNDLFIVSVGTGKVKGTDFSKKNIASEYILSRESETTHYQLTQIFEAANAMDNYYRLDPYMGKANEEMDDTSDENLQALKKAGVYSGDMLEQKLSIIADKLLGLA